MSEANVTVTVLVENSVGVPLGLIGEWGLAMLVDWAGHKFLFDTGEQGHLLGNAARLGVDLQSVHALVMSHGHYDHTGGMRAFLRHRGQLPVYAHPDFFAPHYTSSPQERYIGVPFCQEELTGSGARFIFSREPVEIAPGLWLSGEIPRRTSYETGDSRLYRVVEGNKVADPVLDDLSLFGVTSEGLVIILGCAHAGLVNIIEHARQVTRVERVYGLVGGTHLGPVSDHQRDATLEYLKQLDLQFIAVNHCTGLPVMAQLAGIFGPRFRFAPAGTKLELPAAIDPA